MRRYCLNWDETFWQKPNSFYARQPGERARDNREMRAIIDGYANSPGWVMLNAWSGVTPLGEAVLRTGQLERTAHIGMIGIGVRQSHWSRGLGRSLMGALEDHAEAFSLERLEFTVLAQNRRARDFYKRLGYVEEGRKRRSVRFGLDPVEGKVRFADEILMAKWIGPRNCIDTE